MQIKYRETGSDIACVSNFFSIFFKKTHTCKQKYASAGKILIEKYFYS